MKSQIVKYGAGIMLLVTAYLIGRWQSAGPDGANPEPTAMTPAPRESRSLTAGAGGGKAEPGPGDADLSWVNSFRGSDGRLSPDRMKEAVTAALGDSDPVKAMSAFTRLLRELTTENASAALEAITDGTTGGNAARYLSLLAHAWGMIEGKPAMTGFDTLRGRDRGMAKGIALAAWAATDPDGAIQWMRERNALTDVKRDKEEQTAISRGLLGGLARSDIDAAMTYLLTLSEEQQADQISVVADQKLKEGVTVSADWAMRLPDGDVRVNALETVGGTYLQKDLKGAVHWAEEVAHLADSHELVADVANELANRDPQGAAAWVSRLPAGPSQDHAFEDVFENWTRADPLAASQNLTGMEPGAARDAAIQAFSRTLSRENPQDALEWAGVITDTDHRAKVQVDIARHWQARSPDEAQAWIAANLSPDLQAKASAPRR